MGRGRSKSSSENQTGRISYLEAFKENSRQFNAALQRARDEGYAQLQYTAITGQVINRYWNGATFTDRKSSLYESLNPKYKRKGVLKVKFRA